MKVRTLSVICLLTCLVVAAPTLAQRGPASRPFDGDLVRRLGTERARSESGHCGFEMGR